MMTRFPQQSTRAAALAPTLLHASALTKYRSYRLRGIQRLSEISPTNSTERYDRNCFVTDSKKPRRWIPRNLYDLYLVNKFNAVLPVRPAGRRFLAQLCAARLGKHFARWTLRTLRMLRTLKHSRPTPTGGVKHD